MVHVLHVEYDTEKDEIKLGLPKSSVCGLGMLEHAKAAIMVTQVSPQFMPKIVRPAGVPPPWVDDPPKGN